LPPEAPAILDKIYSFDSTGIEAAKRMEQERPVTRWISAGNGSLVVAHWCTSAEFKYGMSDARRHPSSKQTALFELAAGLVARRSAGQTERIRGNAVLCRDG